jgi:hypothetical protein
VVRLKKKEGGPSAHLTTDLYVLKVKRTADLQFEKAIDPYNVIAKGQY